MRSMLSMAVRVAAEYSGPSRAHVALIHLIATQPEFSERLGLDILSQLESESGYDFYHGYDTKGSAIVADVKPNGFNMHTKPMVWDAGFQSHGKSGTLKGGILLACIFSDKYVSPSPSEHERKEWTDQSLFNKTISVKIHAAYWNKRRAVDSTLSVDLGDIEVVLDEHEDFVVQMPSSAGSKLKNFIEEIMNDPPADEFIPRNESVRKRLKNETTERAPSSP